MTTTESTSQNFLLLLKKRNKRKGNGPSIFLRAGVMSVGTLVTPVRSLAANTEGFAASLSHWPFGLGFSKTVRF